jgi:cytidylate kinase
MKVNIGGVKYVPGFYGKKRPDAALSVNNFFREWEKRRLAIQKRELKPKVPPTICFSRKIGVGVLEIADILAEKIGYRVVDREILEYIAKEEKLSRKTVAFFNEQYPGIISEYISWIFGEKAFSKSDNTKNLFSAIFSIANLEPSIFVGRGAYLLLPRDQVLAVRFICSDEFRIKRLAKILNLREIEVAGKLVEIDKEQRDFFKQVYGKKDLTPDEFDMIINCDYITEPLWAAGIVAKAFQMKFGNQVAVS